MVGARAQASKFRNLCRIFDVSHAKRRKMTFFERCPVGWGGVQGLRGGSKRFGSGE